jgi:thiol-disulfide isomerase/thioredoxin
MNLDKHLAPFLFFLVDNPQHKTLADISATDDDDSDLSRFLSFLISSYKFIVFGADFCHYCHDAIELLESTHQPYIYIKSDNDIPSENDENIFFYFLF